MPQRLKKTGAACLLVAAIFVGAGGFLLVPHTAHAQSTSNIVGDFSACAGGALLSLGVSTALSFFGLTVPTADISNIIKEKVEDCVAWTVANAVLEQITGEVIGYVNTGFDGNPVYVTDINGELRRVADSVFSGFTQSGWLNSVSPSIREELIFSVLVDYNNRNDFGSRISSTLDDDLYDIDAFLDGTEVGSFNQNGGWNTWFKLTQEPQNNIYGAFLLAQEEANRRVSAGITEKGTEINIGGGFLSEQVCEPQDGVNQDGTPLPPICKIVTPGAVVHESLTKVFGSGIDRIIQADELNEVFSLLMTNLINEVLSSDEGLRGIDEFISESTGFEDVSFGSSVDWACHHDFGGEAASSVKTSNLGDYTVTQERSGRDTKLRVDAETQKFYERAEISFGVFVQDIFGRSSGHDLVADLARSSITGTYGGYFSLAASDNGKKIGVDFHGFDFKNASFTWTENTQYQVEIVLDSVDGTITATVFDVDGNRAGSVTNNVAAASDIVDTGDGLFFYPHDNEGWVYEDITVKLYPGGPHNGGARGPCDGTQTSGGGVEAPGEITPPDF